jgi:hypothetical protein
MLNNTQITSIAELMAQPESKTLEFKRDLSSPKPLLKTLAQNPGGLCQHGRRAAGDRDG